MNPGPGDWSMKIGSHEGSDERKVVKTAGAMKMNENFGRRSARFDAAVRLGRLMRKKPVRSGRLRNEDEDKKKKPLRKRTE